ncbi:recombinase family protein [Maridesulfovibrio sp.]|uniref:recombinase family protein n=1 Tax=Maridesulfovibrio sp. TaxID=2795000 RepID=UPI002A186D2E|nr:recombinase family protein [Maridesulfovibrio sp.]
MTKVVAYMRVSTHKQDTENQELEILRYASSNDMNIDHWFKLEISSRKSLRDRRIDELMDMLASGDTLIVSELSRLGRSLSQIVAIVDELIERNVTFIAIKQNMILDGKNDMTAKIQIAMFGVLAEIERDLISDRTRSGLARAKANGKTLGRPKSSQSSILDEKKNEIAEMLEKGISKASVAKVMGVSGPALHYFLKTRQIAR